MQESKHLHKFAVIISLTSLFFWGWALLNCIDKGFDLGIVSFATTFLSSNYILMMQSDKQMISKLAQSIICGTHLFVALNYLLGVAVSMLMDLGTSFMIYCAIFTVLWIQVALVGGKLIQSARIDAYDEGNRGTVIA